VLWVISVYFNIRNTLPKSGTFLLGHPVYLYRIRVYNLIISYSSLIKKYRQEVKLNIFRFNAVS
jgi:hypothetical protein